MQTVYKYKIGSNITELLMPKGAKILSVGNQSEQVVLWAQVDPEEKETEVRNIKVVLTGQHTNLNSCKFIGTVLLASGHFVVHIYEEGRA